MRYEDAIRAGDFAFRPGVPDPHPGGRREVGEGRTE